MEGAIDIDISHISGRSGDANVRVFLRVRDAPANIIKISGEDTIHIDSTQTPNPFHFDWVASPKATQVSLSFWCLVTYIQEEIFEKIGRPMTDSCLEGYHGTIFAYGQVPLYSS